MKIAITGASGHVGNNLCRMLLAEGHQVKALVHKDTRALAGLPVEHVTGEVRHEADLSRLCEGCSVVFNLAAYISIRKNDPLCHKINVESCEKLVRAARATGVKKIIHFSSIHALRHEPLDQELNETRELALDSPFSYDRSKAESQQFMLENSSSKLEIIVINPTAVIGPHDFKPSLTGNALIRFYLGKNPAMIPGGYDWVDVRDVCHAALRAMEKGKPGECYLVSGSWQSLKTLTKDIEELGGHRAPWLELPMWMAEIYAPFLNLPSSITKKEPLYTSVSLYTLKNSHRNISCEKARLALGYNPRPFPETLADTLGWFRKRKFI
jgi:dihydroflavonol-4-reductase